MLGGTLDPVYPRSTTGGSHAVRFLHHGGRNVMRDVMTHCTLPIASTIMTIIISSRRDISVTNFVSLVYEFGTTILNHREGWLGSSVRPRRMGSALVVTGTGRASLVINHHSVVRAH